MIAKELIDFRTGLRWYDPMRRIAGRHVLGSTQDIADVAAYVAGLAPSSDTTPGSGRGQHPRLMASFSTGELAGLADYMARFGRARR